MVSVCVMFVMFMFQCTCFTSCASCRITCYIYTQEHNTRERASARFWSINTCAHARKHNTNESVTSRRCRVPRAMCKQRSRTSTSSPMESCDSTETVGTGPALRCAALDDALHKLRRGARVYMLCSTMLDYTT